MKIWMHTIGYPPGRIGGTEVHVQELSEGLVSLGHEVHVSMPTVGLPAKRCETHGVVLHEGGDTARVTRMISDARPDIVHFHPLYLDNTIDLIEVCGPLCPVIVSYHTPTLTCMRGNLLRMGTDVCDGLVEHAKCSGCVLNQKGLAPCIASIVGAAPAWLCSAASAMMTGRLRSMAKWPLRVRGLKADMQRLWQSCSRMIVVCNWLHDMVVANGMPNERISVVRYGRKRPGSLKEKPPAGPLRLGYAGRLTDQKGVEVLLDAIEQVSQHEFSVEFCAPEFEQENGLADRIRSMAAGNPSIRIKGSVPPEEVVAAMREWDAVLVPSVWMETGPMVVTEAFHAGVPVIGSNRGGIAELVEDGKTGILCEAGSSEALAEVIRRTAGDPEVLRHMSANITGGRETMDMVRDVESVYRVVAG